MLHLDAAAPGDHLAPDEQRDEQQDYGQHDADPDPLEDPHRRRVPQCVASEVAGSQLSARTVTPSSVTERKPPSTS